MTILVSDDFTGTDEALADASKWSLTQYIYSLSPDAARPRIRSNKLYVQGTGGGSLCSAVSKNALDLTAGGVHIKVSACPVDNGSMLYFGLHSASNLDSPWHRIRQDSGSTIHFHNSANTNSYQRAYNPLTDVYWRMQVLDGMVYAYTSPTGAAGSWVQLGTAQTALISVASVKASLVEARWTGTIKDPILIDDYQADTSPIGGASAGVAPSITSAVYDGRIFRHSGVTWSIGATGSIVETGLYTGFTPNQIRLVQDGTNTPLSGFDWTTIGSASAGNYAHTFTSVPQAVGTGWYNVQLRDSAVPATIVSTGKRGVGIHIGVYGQSQASANAVIGDSTLTPTGMARIHGDQETDLYHWAPLATATMNGYIAADIYLNSLTGGKVPIAFLNFGYGGRSLVSGGFGSWLPLTSSYYTYFKNMVASLEGSVDAMVHVAGESDANASVSQASFYAGLGTLFDATRTDCGNANLPIIQVILGDAGSYWNDAQGEAIRAAQVQRCNDANTYRVESYDAELGADLLHRSATGFAEVARRWAKVVAYTMGLVPNWRSPRITSVASVTATVYDANIAYDGATDFTPTSGITGLKVTDSVLGTVLSPTSVVRQSATKIRITLPATPTNPPKVAVAYGASAASNFADNSALGLPLEYTAGVVSSAYVPKYCNVTLTTNGSTPAASQSGIVWAWYDSAPPDLSALPAVNGTGATTDAAGVFSVLIDNSVLTAGQVGTLLAVINNGTPGSAANKAFCAPVAVT